jgi:hypothetical protein
VDVGGVYFGDEASDRCVLELDGTWNHVVSSVQCTRLIARFGLLLILVLKQGRKRSYSFDGSATVKSATTSSSDSSSTPPALREKYHFVVLGALAIQFAVATHPPKSPAESGLC